MADVLDILDVSRDTGPGAERKAPPKRPRMQESRKPSGIKGLNREVYALLDKDSGSLIPTDFADFSFQSSGYKTPKADLSMRRVVKWNWVPFTNPARKDGFQLYHWRRESDKHKEYPFAKMNVTVNVPSYTDAQYQEFLQSDDWSRAETDYLFSLCRRFDLRFITIRDRWDITEYKDRSVEDIKERYYTVVDILARNQTGPAAKQYTPYVFDAEHERKRKEQLKKLYNRTPEEVEEEQQLMAELRKIEQRKKEREKKTQDLQNLIMAADTSCELRRGQEQQANQSRPTSGTASARSSRKKTAKVTGSRTGTDLSKIPSFSTNINIETTGIKFPEPKTTGIWLRSSRMKLPSSVGQKRMKAIDQLLRELNIDPHPMPTEEICRHFNELRSDMVLLYELKMALTSLEFDLQSYKHQFEASKEEQTPATTASTAVAGGSPGKSISDICLMAAPGSSTGDSGNVGMGTAAATATSSSSLQTVIDVSDQTPARKRKAALEQANMMRKLKKNP